MSHNLMNTLKEFKLASGKTGKYYSLPALEKALGNKISRLPVSVRIVLESVLRNCDGKKVAEQHVRQLAAWKPNGNRTERIAARSVSRGMPVRSCSTMRASTKGISSVRLPLGFQAAS